MVHGATGAEHADLPLDFELNGALHVAERVEVLQLGLDAKLFGADRAHRHVGVAAQASLLHVAVVDADGDEHGAEAGKAFGGFGGRAQVGLADDLYQGHTAAVEVQVRAGVGVGKAFVQRLAGILFHVDAGDAYAAGAAAGLELHGTARGERPVVLGNLIPLGRSG